MDKLIIPSLLNVGEVISIADDVLNATEGISANDPRLEQLRQSLSLTNNRLIKNQKYSQKDKHTEPLIGKDKRRDLGYICLRDVVHGMSVSIIEDISKLAAPLYAIFEKYGIQLYRSGYKTESSLLKSLFLELDKPENQQAMTTLGILNLYQSLVVAENEFLTENSTKTEEKSANVQQQEAATDISPEVVKAATKVVGLLQVYAELEPAIYGTAYQNIVTFIAEITATARARNTRKGNGGDGEEPEVPKE